MFVYRVKLSARLDRRKLAAIWPDEWPSLRSSMRLPDGSALRLQRWPRATRVLLVSQPGDSSVGSFVQLYRVVELLALASTDESWSVVIEFRFDLDGALQLRRAWRDWFVFCSPFAHLCVSGGYGEDNMAELSMSRGIVTGRVWSRSPKKAPLLISEFLAAPQSA